MKVSIVMATYNRAALLENVLHSIRRQNPKFEYELIVVDDGSSDNTAEVCARYEADRLYSDRPYYCNPAAARNLGYRAASGDVIIAQSSDTTHQSADVIERLAEVETGSFNIATVWSMTEKGEMEPQSTGSQNQRPFFFLGSLRREDLYAIGGDDEDFTMLGCEDDWFALRLMKGRGLRPVFRGDVTGIHQWHSRPKEHWDEQFGRARALLAEKIAGARASGEWFAAGGPWDIDRSFR